MTSIWSDMPPRPATLLVPCREKLDPEDVRAALATRTGPLAIEAVPPHGGGVAWSMALRHETWAVPLFAWLEPGGEDAPAPWLVGVQGLLDPEDPVLAFEGLTRLVADAFPDAPVLHDADTGLSLPVAELRESDALPGLAWIVRGAHDANGAWIHTRGLRRLGCPEIEMLAVPLARAEAAMQLLDTIAALLVDETDLPEPDTAWSIGPEIAVRLRHWADAVAMLPADTPGVDDGGFDPMERAVVCNAQDPSSSWPAEAVEHAEHGTAAFYTSTRESRNRAAQARGRWPEFVDAFNAWQASDETTRDRVRFHVQAAFETPGPDGVQREHLWFAIESIDDDLVTGRLLNTPHLVTRLEADTTYRMSRDQVSDWQVVRGA